MQENSDRIDSVARKCATAIVKESDVVAIVQDNQDIQLAIQSLADHKRSAVALQTRMERVEQDFETTRQALAKNVTLKSSHAKRQKSDILELKSNVETVATRIDSLEKKFIDLEYAAKDKIDILDKDLQLLVKQKNAKDIDFKQDDHQVIHRQNVHEPVDNKMDIPRRAESHGTPIAIPNNPPKRKKLLSSLSDDIDFNFEDDMGKTKIPDFDEI